MPKRFLTAAELKSLFYIDRDSPTFLRRISNDKVAGHNRVGDGRVRVSIKFKGEYCHMMGNRIVWILSHNRDIPEGYVVDHINGNHLDNNPRNLRALTVSENMQNVVCRKDNSSGIAGVTLLKGGRWRARISIPNSEGRARRGLGLYRTKEEAGEAIKKWRERNNLVVRSTSIKSLHMIHDEENRNKILKLLTSLPLPFSISLLSQLPKE